MHLSSQAEESGRREALAYESTVGSSPESSRPPRARELVYDLRAGSESSERFFRDIAAFSDEVLCLVEFRAGSVLDGYCSQLHDKLRESSRSRGEYALDLLNLGMALRCYEAAAIETPFWVQDACSSLLFLRNRFDWAKPVVDWFQGRIAKLFLFPYLFSNPYRRGSPVERLQRLSTWFGSCGQMKQGALRLDCFRYYMKDLPYGDADHLLQTAVNLFEEFARLAESRFGTYTRGVDRFIRQQCAEGEWREDLLLRAKTPAEYHLNMVASELMNRGLRHDYETASNHVVLVPTCMRSKIDGLCKAVVSGLDIRCAHCDPECSVNRISRMMGAKGIPVYMVPHASGFSRWLKRWQNSGTAVTAAACMLHILPGGCEMRARRIPSQCVPLDFSGCSKHWDDVGFPTALNEGRLVQITTISRSCDSFRTETVLRTQGQDRECD